MSKQTISDAISKINNASLALKKLVSIKKSKLNLEILNLLSKYGYVGKVLDIEDGKQGILEIELIGTINKCNSIKPRFPIKSYKIQDIEKKYLPAKDFGIVIISTSKGLMTQFEAKKENIGGTLIAYCY